MKKLVLFFMFGYVSLVFGRANMPNYRSYLLGDTKGNIYYEKNAEKEYPLASVTKVMTIMVTLDEIRKGKIGLYDEVPIDWEIVSVGGTIIPVKSGDKVLLIDLLKSAAIRSANNAAYALAKYVGKGSISTFVNMMNEKAKKLGLENDLEFHTPAGLPDYMTKKRMDMGTAKGIYGMTMEALKYPEYLAIARQKTAMILNNTYELRSTIKLLGTDGIYGLKTGYHRKARFNITVLSDKDNTNLVTVVMGGKTQDIRDDKVLELNREFHKIYRNKDIIKESVPLFNIPVKTGYINNIDVYGSKNLSRILRKDSDVKIEVNRMSYVKAPMKNGDVVGTYKVLVNGNEIASDKLIIKENIEKKSITDRIMDKF